MERPPDRENLVENQASRRPGWLRPRHWAIFGHGFYQGPSRKGINLAGDGVHPWEHSRGKCIWPVTIHDQRARATLPSRRTGCKSEKLRGLGRLSGQSGLGWLAARSDNRQNQGWPPRLC